jgi:hypothetical protein
MKLLNGPGLLLRVAFLTLVIAACSWAQEITISFEYSNADATLDAISRTDDGNIERLMALSDTKAVIAKRASRDPTVTADTFRESLLEARKGPIKNDPFQWQFSISQAQQVRTLLAALHEKEQTIRNRLEKALAPQLDPTLSLSVTVHYVIGGVSAGWEVGPSDFYVGLPFYKGDIEGVVWTMQHELFHNAQYVGFHDQSKDLARLDARQQEIYRFFDELYREGTATYVANLASFAPDTPYIRDMRQPAGSNWDRMKDNFTLFDTICFRLAGDPNSHFSNLRSLGFDWDWQNPMYYAGDYMSRILVGVHGSLRGYLRQRPTVFVRDYITACTAANKCSYPLSTETSMAVLSIEKRLAKTD